MIFNKSGKVLTNFHFHLDGNELEITDNYQYLGVKVRPSGTFTFAADELCSKARKAWFSLSSLVYKDKRMPVSRAFKLFDSLVSPVALYACEFWQFSILKTQRMCLQGKGGGTGLWPWNMRGLGICSAAPPQTWHLEQSNLKYVNNDFKLKNISAG